MSSRRQKAMEERYLRRKGTGGGMVDDNIRSYPEMTVEEMVEAIKRGYICGLYWNTINFTRKHCDETYKNGAKTYDRAMQFLNSPLMQALT